MTSRRPHRIAGLALVATLAVSACGGADDTAEVGGTDPTVGSTAAGETTATEPTTGDTTGNGDTTATDPQPTTGGAAEVPEVLQLSAPLVGGGDLDLAGFAGRPVALWFWAPG